jgi:hypothetical protein
MERTALRELTFNGYVPGLTDPEGNAAANIHASVAGLGVSKQWLNGL